MSNNNQEPNVIPLPNMQMESPFRLEDQGNYVKLTLHGDFDSIEGNTKLVEDLYKYAEMYSAIEVWINSNGGLVSLMIEILEALKQFETVVTVCNSSAFSAGAMLWAYGDIRVTSQYATIGFHRESYGFYGKTDQHSDLLEHQRKIYPILLEETSGHLLNKEQQERAKVTELYFTGKDMIDNNFAISYEDYRQGDTQLGSRLHPLGTVFLDQEKGTLILVDDLGRGRHISAIEEQSPYEFMIYDYVISNKVRVQYDHKDEFDYENQEDFDEVVDRFYSMMEEADNEELNEGNGEE